MWRLEAGRAVKHGALCAGRSLETLSIAPGWTGSIGQVTKKSRMPALPIKGGYCSPGEEFPGGMTLPGRVVLVRYQDDFVAQPIAALTAAGWARNGLSSATEAIAASSNASEIELLTRKLSLALACLMASVWR